MDHACEQCGALVEDGRPFCPNCRAPQIKVPVRPPTAPVTEPLPPGTPEDLQPPAEPMTGVDDAAAMSERESLPPEKFRGGKNKLVWRPAIGSALVAGVLAAIGASIPIIPLAVLCMFASGGLAVTLYRRRVKFRTVTPWMGAKLGLLSGGWGFGVLAILSTFRLFAASERVELHAAFRDKLQEATSKAADPDVRQAMDQFRGYIATDHGLIIMVFIFLAVAAIFFLIFAALGGVLGATLFGRESGKES
ncbi:MAG: hypothetical protein ABSD13_12110 [Candidatus Korobacteraceae bacterium]